MQMNNVKDNLNIDKNKILNNDIDDHAQSMLNNGGLMNNKSNRDRENIDGKENGVNNIYDNYLLKNDSNVNSSKSNINQNVDMNLNLNKNISNDFQKTNHLNQKLSFNNNEPYKQINTSLNDKNLKHSLR
jgi:hypothetical protein